MKVPPDASRKPRESLELLPVIRAIIRDDSAEVSRLLEKSPSVARESLSVGASREEAINFFFNEISHYLYAGDTPLHAAAAGYRINAARALLKNGADVSARNRRGAAPLHYAADGGFGARNWNPDKQAETIDLLISAGADPNSLDKSG